MTSQFSNMMLSSNVIHVVLFLLSSLVICPSFMSISSLVQKLWQFLFIKNWPEIRKSEIPPSEFCPRWLRRVKNTKLGTNVSIEILLNAAKCQGCSFYHFWVIKGKLTEEKGGGGEGGRGVKLPLHPPTQIRVKKCMKFWEMFSWFK